MESPLATFVEDCTKLASEVLEDWSAHASNVASKLDEGTYDADSAVADLAVTATLATEGGLRLTFGWLDALAVLTGRPGRHLVTSYPLKTKLLGATLTLAGPFRNGHKTGSLPESAITIEPSALGATESEFILRADATGRPAGAYVGIVTASTPGDSEDVIAVIPVP